MSQPPEPAKKPRWPWLGIVAGPIILGVPALIFLRAMLAVQRNTSSGGIANPEETLEQFRLMSISAVALFLGVPLGAGLLIFSLMRLAKLRRQTPPKLPATLPPPAP